MTDQPINTESQNTDTALPVNAETKNHPALGYKKEIILSVGLVLLIVILVGIISSQQQKAENNAWKDIFIATYVTQTQGKDLTTELNEAIAKNKGAKANFYAYMLELSSSGAGLEKANLEKAEAAAKSFIEKYPTNPLINNVRLDYATVLFNLDKLEDALKNYNLVLKNNPNYLEGEAMLFRALTLEKLGKKNEALDAYTAIASSSNKNMMSDIKEYATFARSRLQQTDTAAAATKDAEKAETMTKSEIAPEKEVK